MIVDGEASKTGKGLSGKEKRREGVGAVPEGIAEPKGAFCLRGKRLGRYAILRGAKEVLVRRREEPCGAAMAFVTYENRRNPHVTIHLAGCSQIAKRGGEHKHGQGAYHEHETYAGARLYAEQTGLRLIECSYCKPPGEQRPAP